jgi:hypothetical protein
MNTDTQAPFTYKDACIALNPHVGGNPATAIEARKAVSDFLQALLKLCSDRVEPWNRRTHLRFWR